MAPTLVIEYTDPLEGFRGWFVRHSLDHALCAGGMRLQAGLDRGHLEAMARNMGCKMRIAGLGVDGAKCGIDYRPEAPGKKAAIRRFLAALRPYIESVYSMGPDFNVDMALLEEAAAELGIPSVKMAIAKAQGWDLEYFRQRSRVLSLPMADGWTLNRLRAGYGVAAAALAIFDLSAKKREGGTAVIQGFGTLAKATALTLLRQGVRIVAIGDADKSYIAQKDGAAVDEALLGLPANLLPAQAPPHLPVRIAEPDALLDVDCDLFIPAAVENAVTEKNYRRLKSRYLVPGANLAVTAEAARLLGEKGIVVLPDYVAGCGGSLSMEGVYGPAAHPAPEDVLLHIERKMTGLVQQVLDLSAREKIPPAAAAERIAQAARPRSGGPPYQLL